jgi:hypothetical protein
MVLGVLPRRLLFGGLLLLFVLSRILGVSSGLLAVLAVLGGVLPSVRGVGVGSGVSLLGVAAVSRILGVSSVPRVLRVSPLLVWLLRVAPLLLSLQ